MKRRRTRSSYNRKRKYIRPNPFFIIVCEGEITEPDYFSSFPYYCKLGQTNKYGQRNIHPAVYIESGAGQHEQVIKKAEQIYKKLSKEYGKISPEEVWCVFDCDYKDKELKKAVEMAKAKKYNAVYSIQCFELWYLLHFQYLTTALINGEYDKRLSKNLKIKYSHNTKGMYKRLLNKQNKAINNAKKLLKIKKDNEIYTEPLTKVHILVEALNDAYDKISK